MARHTQGFTLVELLLATSISGMLMAGISVALYIAVTATDPDSTPGAGILDGLDALAGIARDLQFAQALTITSATDFTIEVADRGDVDSSPEVVRYVWSGVAGTPLSLQLNGGTPTEAEASLTDFGIQSIRADSGVRYLRMWIQTTNDPATLVETCVPLINQP